MVAKRIILKEATICGWYTNKYNAPKHNAIDEADVKYFDVVCANTTPSRKVLSRST